MAIREFGGPEKLEAISVPRPRPAKGEILIRIVAAGVNPVDWKIIRGDLGEMWPHRFPLIPGWDAAGVVEEIGEGAGRFRKGDRVWAYARKPEVQWGCYTEYLALAESNVALMPPGLLFEEAAALPLAGLTAWQCLFGDGELERDSTVMVHAAGGGVGHFAVQLAKRAGARVYGTAGVQKLAFVSSLGADGVIDYTAEDFRVALRRQCPDGVDLLLDAVGGDTLSASYELVKPGGRLISIVDMPDAAAAERHGITAKFRFVEPNAEQLERMASMVERKQLRPRVQKIYRLKDAVAALRASIDGHVEGKLVLAL